MLKDFVKFHQPFCSPSAAQLAGRRDSWSPRFPITGGRALRVTVSPCLHPATFNSLKRAQSTGRIWSKSSSHFRQRGNNCTKQHYTYSNNWILWSDLTGYRLMTLLQSQWKSSLMQLAARNRKNSRIKLEIHVWNMSNHGTGHKHKNQVLTSEQEQDETGAR